MSEKLEISTTITSLEQHFMDIMLTMQAVSTSDEYSLSVLKHISGIRDAFALMEEEKAILQALTRQIAQNKLVTSMDIYAQLLMHHTWEKLAPINFSQATHRNIDLPDGAQVYLQEILTNNNGTIVRKAVFTDATGHTSSVVIKSTENTRPWVGVSEFVNLDELSNLPGNDYTPKVLAKYAMKKDDGTYYPVLVMEELQGIDLLKLFRSHQFNPKTNVRKIIINNLGTMIDYLVSQGFLHPDLSAENIIVDLGNEHKTYLFDWADNIVGKVHRVGTPNWIAPELYSGLALRPTLHSHLFTFGLFVYFILTGELLIDIEKGKLPSASDYLQMINNVVSNKINSNPKLNQAIKEILVAILNPDPKERVTKTLVLLFQSQPNLKEKTISQVLFSTIAKYITTKLTLES